MADSDNESGGHGGESSSLTAREHDRFLPIANVSRIMKKALPANAKISKEAKETVQECVSEFISFITGEASDKCQKEKRKTINGDDLLWAMTTLGFEEYVEPLKGYLQKFRELEGEKTAGKPDGTGADGGSVVNTVNAGGSYSGMYDVQGNMNMNMNMNMIMMGHAHHPQQHAHHHPMYRSGGGGGSGGSSGGRPR